MSQHLITAQELAETPTKQLVIIDCRFSLADVDEGERLYEQSHISGAHYFHLDRDMSGSKSKHGGRHPLPEVKIFEQRLRSIGVNQHSLVVVYDDQRFAFASRLWWLLRYLGHDQVKVLDGGYQAWRQIKGSCDAELPVAAAGDFTARVNEGQVVGRQQVIDRGDQVVLIDSREAARFQGLEEPIDPVAGHIEGAVNYPWQGVSNEQLMFDREHNRWAGLSADDEVIVYCGSGVTACVNLLSLAESGYQNSKLYAGSWSDWCSYL